MPKLKYIYTSHYIPTESREVLIDNIKTQIQEEPKCVPFEGCIFKHAEKRGADASELLDCIADQLDETHNLRVAISTSISSMGKTTLWDKMTADYPNIRKDVKHGKNNPCTGWLGDDEEACKSKLFTTLMPIGDDVDTVILLSPKTKEIYAKFLDGRGIEKNIAKEYIENMDKETSRLRRELAIERKIPFIEIKVDIE